MIDGCFGLGVVTMDDVEGSASCDMCRGLGGGMSVQSVG
jgi:hypothetical protein